MQCQGERPCAAVRICDDENQIAREPVGPGWEDPVRIDRNLFTCFTGELSASARKSFSIHAERHVFFLFLSAEIYHPIRAWRYFIMKKHIVSALSMALCLGLTAGSAVTRVTSASCKFVTHFIFLILSYLSGTMFIWCQFIVAETGKKCNEQKPEKKRFFTVMKRAIIDQKRSGENR